MRPLLRARSLQSTRADHGAQVREMDREKFLSRLTSARREWDAALASVPWERMTTPGVNGGWSVKDLVAHITWSEREMMEVIRQRALVGSPLWALGQDERNAIVYAVEPRS
jgi:uncharacterized damage-inducible protein DinB